MSKLTFWPKRIYFLCSYFLFHKIFSIYYWGKRKTIPPLKNQILLKSATELARNIREGKLKSAEVVKAYIDRISEVNPYINAVVEDRFKDALKEAHDIDKFIETYHFDNEYLEQRKPLLGVPFTVKVIFNVKGFRCTVGSLVFKDRIADCDAPTVTLLKNAGGILLATTNIPEFGSGLHSQNLVHGTTCNPYDTTKTSGGSSGGESAIISSAGSVIGVGNDVLGSVRYPASFCCLYSHKATVGWISNEGSVACPPPPCSYMLYTGPICRYAEDLITTVNVLTNDENKYIKPKPEIDFHKLKIYYQTGMRHAWTINTDQEIIQGIERAASYFKETYGAQVKEVNIPLLKCSNGIALHALLRHIPDLFSLVTFGQVCNVNGFVEIIKSLFRKSTYSLSAIITGCFGKSFFFYDERKVTHYELVGKNLEKEFDSLLDENSVFLYPTCPTSAPYHNEMYFILPSNGYVSAFNYLGFPVTQCPLGLNGIGMPIGMQIVARKNNDALTIACAIQLDKVFGGWIPPDNITANNNV